MGLSYVGVSIDGIGAVHDRFRGVEGAFQAALKGMRNCMEEGIKVGIRFTVTKSNYLEIPAIFDLAEAEEIPPHLFFTISYIRGADRRLSRRT